MEFLPDRSQVVLRYILERNARERPDKASVIFEDGERWTYQEARDQAYRAANVLAGFGVTRGEPVLIFLPNGRTWIQAWWGLAALGAILVPVNTAYKGEMLKHICQDSKARFMITSPELAWRLEGLSLDIPVIDPTTLSQAPPSEPLLETPLEPWDTHTIVYTSGTTGPSKGAVLSYFKSYRDCDNWEGIATAEDIILADLPFFHVGGLANVYALWKVGGGVALRTGFSGSRYLEIVRECGATLSMLLGTMPSFLANTSPLPDDDQNPLRVVFCAPMVSDPGEFIRRFGLEKLITTFGMTESCAVFQSQSPFKDPKSCGRVQPGVEARLVDSHDIPVPTNEIGELIIRTDLPWQMSTAYYGRPGETAQAWRNGWFHTGDLFTCDEEGYFYFVDRKKDALRRRGENISSFEVEREVLTYPGVREAACVAVPGQFGEDEIKIFVVPSPDRSFDPAELIRFLIPRMPYFMIPRFVEVMDELPKTATMRVKKFELRARAKTDSTWDREEAGIVVTRNS